jgi:hypothetical protein
LPGALLLAVPFVLLGNSAHQNLFWLFAFLFSLNSYLKDRRLALLLLWVILALAPVVLTVLQSIQTANLDFGFTGYGLFFAFLWRSRSSVLAGAVGNHASPRDRR